MAGKKKKTVATLILDNGTRWPVMEITSKYYICENTRFRKLNPAIKDIIIAEKDESKTVQ